MANAMETADARRSAWRADPGLTGYKSWAEAVSLYRAPLIVAVLAAVAFSSSDQIIDLYRLHLETSLQSDKQIGRAHV